MTFLSSQKLLVRSKVWPALRKVAVADSRFHHDYSCFIADFEGSSAATDFLVSLQAYIDADLIFIAPDNCLQELRYRSLRDGKIILVTTYGIRRGFWILDSKKISISKWEVASMLDGMEKFGQHITLDEIRSLNIGLMVTGAGAVNLGGLRLGKGHGYFDLEWAMLYSIGSVTKETKTVAIVHECQVLDEEVPGEEWDVGCDFVVTNEKVNVVNGSKKPSCGVLWNRLEGGKLEDIEPLKELKQMQADSDR